MLTTGLQFQYNKNSKLIEIQNTQSSSSAKKVERNCNVATSTPRVAEKANRTFSPNSGRGIMQTSQQQLQKQSKTDPKQKQHRQQPHHGKKQGQQQVTDVNNNDKKKLADAPLSTTLPSHKAESQEQVWPLNHFTIFVKKSH